MMRPEEATSRRAPGTGGDSPSTLDPLLAEVVRRLVDAYAPERIYLFGSRARGDARPDRDYDLLVLLADSDQPSPPHPWIWHEGDHLVRCRRPSFWL